MPILSSPEHSQAGSVLASITRWSSFISGCLSVLIGFLSICAKNVRLEWPSDFLNDGTNYVLWRKPLFSFTPETFIDVWTPMVMGLITVLMHLEFFQFPMFTENFARLFLWSFVLAMFGNFGYAGGMGIIVGALTICVAAISLVTAFFHDGPARLDLALGHRLRMLQQNNPLKAHPIVDSDTATTHA